MLKIEYQSVLIFSYLGAKFSVLCFSDICTIIFSVEIDKNNSYWLQS